MGFEQPEVVHYQELTDGYTYFVMYGRVRADRRLRLAAAREGFEIEYMSEDEIEDASPPRTIGRPIVVVGAAHRLDTHSVGIDAMLNLKGFHGHHGLEGYQRLPDAQPRQPGAQQRARLRKAIELDADAILVSQTVTQQNLHIAQPDRARRDRRSRGTAQAADPHLRRPARLQRAGQGARLRRRLLQGHLPAPPGELHRARARRPPHRRPRARGQLSRWRHSRS